MPRKPKSPYQRYAKRPYRYSELYREWDKAARDGNEKAMREAGRRHTERFLGKPVDTISDDC